MNAERRMVTPAGARTSTRTRLVADALREAIVDGRLRDGERLVEQRLADALGVSRQPVREALRLLAREGLVQLAPRQGARVATPSHITACELVEVGRALERLGAKLAALRRDAAFADAAHALLASGDAASADAHADALADHAEACSELIRLSAANDALADLLVQIRHRTHAAIGPAVGDARGDWREQSAIMRAVVAGDAELASRLAQGRATRAGARFLAGDRSPCVACPRGFPPERRPEACPAASPH